jgi:hypothetical protein
MLKDCLSPEQLKNYLSGAGVETDALAVELHVAVCACCQQSLQSMLVRVRREFEAEFAEPSSADPSGFSVAEREALLQVATFRSQSTVPVTRAASSVRLPPITLPSRYTPVRWLGSGGMGEVWEVDDSVLSRTVAIKFLKAGLPGIQEIQRLLHEAVLLGRLSHRGVVRVYEVLTEFVAPAIVMEYIPGPSLQTFMTGRLIPAVEAAGFVIQICAALSYAHANQVVHRDIKPSNILLRPHVSQSLKPGEQKLISWEPVLTDFGTAVSALESRLTLTGQIVGTPAYMAPEQAEGETSLTPAVDLYGVGVLLYELLTGRPPFVADTVAATLELVKSGDVPSMRILRPDLPQDLQNICLKCLSRQPQDRYTDAEQLRDDLQSWLDGRPVLARPLSWPARVLRWCRRNKAFTAFIATTTVGILLVSAQSVYFGLTQRALRNRATVAEQVATNNQKLAETRAAELQKSLQSATDVVERLLTAIGPVDTTDAAQVSERKQMLQQAVVSFQNYVAHFCPAGIVAPEHLNSFVQLLWLRLQIDPAKITKDDLERLADSLQSLSQEQKQQPRMLRARLCLCQLQVDYYGRASELDRLHSAFRDWAELQLQQAEQLPAGSPEMFRALRARSGILMNFSAVLQNQGIPVEGAQVAESGIASLERVLAIDRSHPADLLNLLVIADRAARCWQAAGEPAKARAVSERALAHVPGVKIDNPEMQRILQQVLPFLHSQTQQ